MIEPFLADAAFLADVAQRSRSNNALHLWWLGQSGFLIQWRNSHLLMDPYLSDSLEAKYARTDMPHARMTRRPIAPEKLTFIDVLTASHSHTDHLDGETVAAVLRNSPRARFIVPGSVCDVALTRSEVSRERIEAIEAGATVEHCGFRITAIPSAHEKIETDELGRHRFLGYVVQMGPWNIYHSGDTVLYEGLAESLRRYRIDVALLPINGQCGRVPGNLTASEAAGLAKAAGVRLVIPCHYDMFAFNTGKVDDFIAGAKGFGQAYAVLRCGESWSSESLGAAT